MGIDGRGAKGDEDSILWMGENEWGPLSTNGHRVSSFNFFFFPHQNSTKECQTDDE